MEDPGLALLEEPSAPLLEIVEGVAAHAAGTEPPLAGHAGEDGADGALGEAEGLEQGDERAHPHRVVPVEQVLSEESEDQVLRPCASHISMTLS